VGGEVVILELFFRNNPFVEVRTPEHSLSGEEREMRVYKMHEVDSECKAGTASQEQQIMDFQASLATHHATCNSAMEALLGLCLKHHNMGISYGPESNITPGPTTPSRVVFQWPVGGREERVQDELKACSHDRPG
jgi:hypothetical protein